ncbi:nitrous oxide reductase accessory protein NosL [Rhodobacter xanthinilyticus]|uniref:nitrous oxide reductase accessory protein NosL n=1 Tax=Rhodobacter xanthinilyticus TaxID=1850250 RepID=UPI0009F6DD61|nr:nitrous oxide reductase accessory protein NosL [Rhodobacter xanthinilyticus]
MCKISRPASRRQVLGGLLGSAAVFGLAPRGARAGAAAVDLPAPGPRDICPVCGMFVAKYPDWIATILFADGHAEHFDGAKDFFKYLNDMPKYAQGRSADQITTMGVTDYYGVTRVAAGEALYAAGSDVLGPMGHELVPLADAADAAEFMADHQGRRLMRFDEVTGAVLATLDAGDLDALGAAP